MLDVKIEFLAMEINFCLINSRDKTIVSKQQWKIVILRTKIRSNIKKVGFELTWNWEKIMSGIKLSIKNRVIKIFIICTNIAWSRKIIYFR